MLSESGVAHYFILARPDNRAFGFKVSYVSVDDSSRNYVLQIVVVSPNPKMTHEAEDVYNIGAKVVISRSTVSFFPEGLCASLHRPME